MAHRGRKRRAKRREPNGDVQRASRAQVREAVTAVAKRQPHRRQLNYPMDQKASDALGQVRLAELITEREYQAGAVWQRARAAMLRARGLPSPNPKSAGFDYVHDRLDEHSAPDEYDLRSPEEKAASAIARFNKLLAALSEPHLLRAKMQVWRVCDDGLMPLDTGHVALLKEGLGALAAHLKIEREGLVEVAQVA